MANAGVISSETSGVPVRAIHTDEESMIAKIVCGVFDLDSKKEN
jgi:acetate kinase